MDSIRDAVLTVSPKRQYRGMVRPTTPATQGPETQMHAVSSSRSWTTEKSLRQSFPSLPRLSSPPHILDSSWGRAGEDEALRRGDDIYVKLWGGDRGTQIRGSQTLRLGSSQLGVGRRVNGDRCCEKEAPGLPTQSRNPEPGRRTS